MGLRTERWLGFLAWGVLAMDLLHDHQNGRSLVSATLVGFGLLTFLVLVALLRWKTRPHDHHTSE